VSFSLERSTILLQGYLANVLMMTDKPNEDPNIRGDAFKTLMVCRLSYQANEEDLEREFGRIGAIERVCHPALQIDPSQTFY
jgi:hypothetical protein